MRAYVNALCLNFVHQKKERHLRCRSRAYSQACEEQSQLGSNKHSTLCFIDGMLPLSAEHKQTLPQRSSSTAKPPPIYYSKIIY